MVNVHYHCSPIHDTGDAPVATATVADSRITGGGGVRVQQRLLLATLVGGAVLGVGGGSRGTRALLEDALGGGLGRNLRGGVVGAIKAL